MTVSQDNQVITRSLEVPGATVTYDIRPNDASTERPLLLVGSPMGAAGFGTLASYFTDRTVVTYDPRGVERSPKEDPKTESTPLQHADDVHRIVDEVDGGPVDIFASSGGAVNGLALVATHPDAVATLVAHEPPIAGVLPDREEALAANIEIRDTYFREGWGPAMAKFIALVRHTGSIPEGFGRQPMDPAAFGLPTEDDGSREDPLFAQNMVTCTHFEPDFSAIMSAGTRVVLAAGVGSEDQVAARAAAALAERLGTPLVVFPGDHGGFLGGEYGQTGEPEAFAIKLAEVLSGG